MLRAETQRWDQPEGEPLMLVEMSCDSLCGLYMLLVEGCRHKVPCAYRSLS